ncbi:MAG: hypothetical protein IKI13_00345 [Bacteroidales bacterium]|nr:hypothetical protein [Bacteroidales bacterium]
MKYISRIVFILSLAFGLVACNEVVVIPEAPVAGEVPFELTFSTAEKTVQTKSKVKGAENAVHTMQLVCFDANGQYLGIRNATVTSTGPGTNPPMFDTGKISGTVPQNTARIHFIANRKLPNSLTPTTGTSEAEVMNHVDLSTVWNDADHQEICFWGYHKEADAAAMNEWLKPAEGSGHTVYMIRDRARVILSYDPTGSTVPVTKIEWLIHNGRERGYLAPAATSWTNDGYYANSQKEGHTNELVSVAGMHEYTTCDRYSLWRSQADNDSTAFDVAYQNSANTNIPQYLFDDDNAAIDDLKVILRVTYTVDGSPKTVYHVLRLNDDDGVLYDVVRNNTYYINCKLLSPDVAYYDSLKDAIDGEEFVNADVEIDRTIPDINDDRYTLQIKLPTETTSIVFNTEEQHKMDFVFRMVSDVNVTGSTDPSDFEVTWEKSQTFCENSLPVTYNSTTKQFTITATVKTGQLTDQLQDEWIVVKHKSSGLTRYIHVYVIDQFRYKINPTLTKVGNDYRLSFTLPPMEHSRFLPDGSPDPTELIYPESLYPIDIKFTTNTLNAYGITQGTENYGLFGVSVEETSSLTNASNFEPGYNSPVSSTNYNADRTHWYFQQADNYWDFWYTYNLKSYPEGGQVNIFFKDVRDHIKYATVTDVGLFLYVEYFGKNYSVHL